MSLPKKKLEFKVAELSEEWHWEQAEIFKHARLGKFPLKYGANIPLPPAVAAHFEASDFINEVEIEWDGRRLKFQRSGVYLLAEDKLAFERRMREEALDLPLDGTTQAPTTRTPQSDDPAVTKERQMRTDQRHRERCRALAQELWIQAPDLTIEDMTQRDEIIKTGCESREYKASTLRDWIKDLCPDRSPGRRPNSKIFGKLS